MLTDLSMIHPKIVNILWPKTPTDYKKMTQRSNINLSYVALESKRMPGIYATLEPAMPTILSAARSS
jgi:hypothetical protein